MSIASPLYKSLSLSLACLAIAAGCAKSPTPRQPTAAELLLPSYEDLLPGGPSNVDQSIPMPSAEPGTSLSENLARYGVRLSADELERIDTLTKVQPSGKWSRSQSQSPEQNLLANFNRFNILFAPPFDTAEEYRVRAISFAEKTTVPYYLDLAYYNDTKRLLVVKWDETSGEFVVIQSDGSLVNYLTTRAIRPPRYLKIE